jgi:hypothetical protein
VCDSGAAGRSPTAGVLMEILPLTNGMPPLGPSAHLARRDLCISIADIAVRARSGQTDLLLQATGPEATFVVPRADPAVDFRVILADPPPPPAGERLFDVPGVWSLTEDGDDLCLEQALGGGPFRVSRFLRLDAQTLRGELTVAPQEGLWGCRPHGTGHAADPFVYPILPLLIYWQLAAHGGIGIHASGVVIEGCGCVFAGVSGAGKSTVATLLDGAGAIVLNDDRLGLTRGESGFRVHGTPWHGSAAFARPESAPLHAIFFLQHGAHNEAAPMPPLQACAELVARACPPYFSRSLMASVVDTCADLAAAVPCYRLRFVPEASVVETIREVLR